MQPPVAPENPFIPPSIGRLLSWVYGVSTFLLVGAFLCAFVAVGSKSESNAPEAWLLLFAVISTLAALVRQLPAQHVILAALITAPIGSLAHSLGVKSGIPFGPFMFGS